ncbi:hypothetical protein [Salana multivorans]
MSIIHPTNHTDHRISRPGENEIERAVRETSALVAAIVDGEMTSPQILARPLPVAFLDDGRRVFLVVDQGRPASRSDRDRPLDKPRSWGVEVTKDGDLVDNTPSHVAVRSTRRLTPQAAADAVQYALSATA